MDRNILRKPYLDVRSAFGMSPLPEEQLGLSGPDPYSPEDLLKSPEDGPAKPVNLAEIYFGPDFERKIIRDQGRTNRCTGFAGVTGEELMFAKLSALSGYDIETIPLFSANFVYWHTRHNKNMDNGAYLRDLMKTLHKKGAVEESLWRDEQSMFDFPNNVINANKFRIDGYERIRTGAPDSVENMKQVLSVEHLPVFVGMMLHKKSTNNARWDGVFEMPKPGDKRLGGHAMLVIGWMYDKNGRILFIAANSWGTRSGDRGVYYITSEAVRERIVLDAWTVTKSTY